MDMKNLEVGDKVRVVSEKEVRKHEKEFDGSYKFDGDTFMDDMFKFCGKIVTIRSNERKDSSGYYIKEDDDYWYFTYDMLEEIK